METPAIETPAIETPAIETPAIDIPASAAAAMRIDVWSDVVCPWCYIGKRRFESALARFAGPVPVEVTYRAYQLDPTAPPGSTRPLPEAYARKFGGPERAAQIIEHLTSVAADDGITFHLDRAKRANTLLAHRLVWFAGRADDHRRQAAMKERLMAAYFTDALDVSDPDVLADLAAEVGIPRPAATRLLAGDDGLDEVIQDIARATAYGITAVPTYVVDGRWTIPGAQDADTFLAVLHRMAARRPAA